MLSALSAYRVTRLESKGSREDGFSLMELIIVTSILMIVMSAILSMLEVSTRQQRRTTAVVDNQNTVMVAFNRIGRELRGANPIDVGGVAESGELENSVTVWVGSDEDGDRVQWRFRIDPATSELVQECLTGCRGGVPSREVLVPRMVNTASEPLFQYFKGYSDDEAEQLITEAGNSDQAAPDDIAHCTVRIVIHIRSAPEIREGPVYVATTDTEVRNTLPGGQGC